jgi:hypothetical protein
MSDRATFDARLTDAFERYVAPAPIAVNSRAVAAATAAQRMRPALWTPARLLALAALLLVALLAAAVIGTGGHLLDRLALIGPTPIATTPIASVRASSPTPTFAAGAPAWEAIYLRTDPSDATTFQVVAVRPDGAERLLRSLPSTPAGATAALSPNGLVDRTGWLFLYWAGYETGADGDTAVLDLADPTTPTRFLSFRAPVGPRWSTTGLLAIPGYGPEPKGAYELWSAVTILDPRTGATTQLGSLSLFGGGPSIVWAADGSGILDGSRLRPADGSPDVEIPADLSFTDRRVGAGGVTVEICDPAIDGRCTGAHGPTVRVLDPASRATRWYDEADTTIKPTDATFAADGRSVLVMFEHTEGSRRTAIVGRMTGPSSGFEELATYVLPDGGYHPAFAWVSPDDDAFALNWWVGDPSNVTWVSGPILHRDGSRTSLPAGSLAGFVPGPAVESWSAEGPSMPAIASPPLP